MNEPTIWFTAPVLSHGTELWFSAYGFAWGYRAFAIPYEVVCETLGAADSTDEQIRLAFQLGKQTVLRAVRQHDDQPYEGVRIRLLLGHVNSTAITHRDTAALVMSG
ncbi:hypothetical protein [Paraburkholderia sacchari]|uniref:hypothetical protein n=1 Tax=Paraburkholderia sacchari TaxID=159450 RepID=UPI003D99BA8B